MDDNRKTVKLPPELWRILKNLSYQQDVPIVRLIDRWAKEERDALQEEDSKQEFSTV